MKKSILKTVLCVCTPLLLNGCISYYLISSHYRDQKHLETNKQVIPKAREFVEETAPFLDILRYGEFSKNQMYVRSFHDWGLCVFFGFDNRIPLSSQELLEYLPQHEIDALTYLTGSNLTEPNVIKYTYLLNGDDWNFGTIIIDGVCVFITTESYKVNQKYCYIEQVGDYYIQVVAFYQLKAGGPKEYYHYSP